jgi:hypothetical protein
MFDGPELRVVCEVVANQAIEEAAHISDEQALGSTVEDLLEEIMSRPDMELPVLRFEERYAVDSGSRDGVELHVPFDGTRGLFENQPNFYTTNYPEGTVAASEVVLPLGPPEGAEARVASWLQLVEQYLTAVGHDLEIWRREFRERLRGWIGRRRAEAEQHQRGLRGLSIPIYRRQDAPRVFKEPAITRCERPAPTRPSGGPAGEPQLALTDAYYEHILSVIRAAGKAMERSSATYAGWGEEDRRQVLILMLNTHYEGKVFAEAFNGDGKTDILIREEDKNLFIGECKFYDGPQTVTETLDQIFGYATWRDVKLAIVFFVDRVNFTEALKRIKDTVQASPQFRAVIQVSEERETEFRAQMAWPGDETRLVTLHVSAFHTPR